MPALRFALPSLFLLLLAACRSEQPQAQQSRQTLEEVAPTPACEAKTFEGSAFTVCRFNAGRETIELIQGSRSLAAVEARLGARARQVKFAMNAGMYDEEGRPIGLFVSNGKVGKPLNLRHGSGNFHLLPNGVFAQDEKGALSITPSPEFAKRVSSPRWASQSGPMLVIDGKLHSKFDANGQSQLIRNGVGVQDPRTAFFVISEDPVSFGRFARFFRDSLGCKDALYLDGTVSSLWDPAGARQDAYSSLGPIHVVFREAR
jgi:uncharacterized protein YigE (DUF2233 family)